MLNDLLLKKDQKLLTLSIKSSLLLFKQHFSIFLQQNLMK
jgi:hypothetical protein